MTSRDDGSTTGSSDGRSADEHVAPVTPLFGNKADRGTAARRETRSDPNASSAVDQTATALAAISEHWSGEAAVDRGGASHPSLGSRRRSAGSPKETFDDEATRGADAEPEGLEGQRQRAENISLHALSRRGVSSHEMAQLLASRDLDDDVVQFEIERLERVGLLDDAELAATLVRSKQERKGMGRGAVTSELRSRGIDPGVIEQALAATDDDEEQDRADEWARKRVTSLRGLDRATAERRLNAYLMRRGYRSEVVRRAVEKVLPRGGSARGGVRFE